MVKTHEWSPTSQGKALGLRADPDNSLQDITNIINIPNPPFTPSTNGAPELISLAADVLGSYPHAAYVSLNNIFVPIHLRVELLKAIEIDFLFKSV
jgi:hypothetical protein